LFSQSTVVNPPRKSKSLLPVLTVLFVLSYSLLVMLVVEQGSTITSQSWLIRELFADSSQLSAMKGRAILQHNAEVAKAQAEAQSQSASKSPAASQTPSTQVPAEDKAREYRAEQTRKDTPQHPPKPVTDTMDARRALFSI